MLGNDKLCKTKKISEPPFFIVKEKKSTCSDWCFETNTEYVNFLNRNINIIKSNLFSDTENFTLILDATYSNHGQCVVNEKKKKVQCLCKGNYEIMVSEMFYISFLNIINKSLSWNPTQRPIEDIFKEEFSALAILLKFYPHSALFYLVYLFHKYEKTSKLYRFASSSKLIADNVELLNADGNDTKNGLTEDKSSIAENDTDIQIFMNIYKFIVSGSGDILDISKKYYEQHRQEPIYVCLLPIVQYLLWDSHNFTDVHFYSKHDFST